LSTEPRQRDRWIQSRYQDAIPAGDRSAPSPAGPADQPPGNQPYLGLSQYEQLIAEGIADADARGRPVDDVTARRLAIWLAAHPQHPALAKGLVRFTRTGEISLELKTQLRIHARSGNYPDHHQAARLNRYAASRGERLGPVGENFGAACHQIDRADLMLADLRQRAWEGIAPPEPGWPETDGPQTIAAARRDPRSGTITLILDATTASTVIFALAGHADEREAHLREVQQHAQTWPEGSYGRRNRQAIAARESASPPGCALSSMPTRPPPSPISPTSRPSPSGHLTLLHRWPTGKSSWNSERAHRPADRADSAWIPSCEPPAVQTGFAENPRTWRGANRAADPLGN
jgi:hypothetical protein